MKKLTILLIMLVCSTTLSFAQQKNTTKTTPTKVNVEVVLNQHIERINARIDSTYIASQKAIDKISSETKENCVSYYDRLDNEMDRALTKFSWIWGLFGVFIGIFIPIIINKIYERSLQTEIEKLKSDMSAQLNYLSRETSIGMRNLERVTMSRVRERYNDIDQQLEKLKEEASSLGQMKAQLEDIKTKIEVSERNARESQKQAMISRLFSEALSLEDSNKERAIDLYSRIISIDENYLGAYNNRALLYLDIKDYNNAIKDASKIIEIDNRNSSAYAIRAMCYQELEMIDKAIEDLTNCIMNCEGKTQYEALVSRAGMYQCKHMWQKAIEDYDRANKIEPLDCLQLNNRAFAYYNLNKLDIAEKDALEAISKGADENDLYAAYDTLGCIYVAKKLYSEALDCFNKAIELKSELWETYENRANLYKIFIDMATTESEKAKYIILYEKDIEAVRTKKVKKDDEDEE